jgi:hypothetical protein
VTPAKYPSVHLDTFSFCNAKCAFCGYPKMVRPKGKMSQELFLKLVDEIAAWGEPVEISPVHYGEFFANLDWYRILKYLEERLPTCPVSIPTNGSLLTDEAVDKLATIKTLHYVSFSLYAARVETYKALIGLSESDFYRAENAFKRLKALRPDIAICLGTTYNSLFLSPMELDVMGAKWGSAVFAHDISLNRSHGWHRAFPTIEVCSEPFQCLIVLWDGRVCCCCMDPNGELLVGDMNKNTIMEIWNGPELARIRNMQMIGHREAMPLCDSCTCAKWNPRR